MGKKGKKKKNPFDDSSGLILGKKLTVSQVLTQYVLPELEAKRRRPSTVTSLQREVDLFERWWATITKDRLPVADVRRKHLEEFRRWIAANGGSVPKQNGAVRAVLQVIHAAEKHELITHSPKLEALSHRSVAPKVFPSDEEIDRIWQACEQATWPKRTSELERLPYSACDAWRAALVLYRCYGFRTQELVQLELGFRSLTWGNIYAAGITPNPEGKCECQFGWLGYVPQKQERVKPELLAVPLNQYTAAALGLVSQGVHKPSDKVFDWPLSAISFRKQWQRLCELAGVKPRESSGVSSYKIKHLRKAATTAINNHMHGMAEHIVGHGSDRSGQSIVSAKHYNNPEEGVLRCVLTMPVPETFKELIA